MLIQYSLHRVDVGWGGGGGGVFSGVSHLSCCSERLHFKNATDKTDRIINHVSAKHTSLCSDVCWLCLCAGVINQCCVVRGSNMSWMLKQSQSDPHILPLPLNGCQDQVTKGQIMPGDLVCVSLSLAAVTDSHLINVAQRLIGDLIIPVHNLADNTLHLPSVFVCLCVCVCVCLVFSHDSALLTNATLF